MCTTRLCARLDLVRPPLLHVSSSPPACQENVRTSRPLTSACPRNRAPWSRWGESLQTSQLITQVKQELIQYRCGSAPVFLTSSFPHLHQGSDLDNPADPHGRVMKRSDSFNLVMPGHIRDGNCIMSPEQRPLPRSPRFRQQLNIGIPNRDAGAVRAQQVGRSSHEICCTSSALDTSSFISPKQPKGLGKRKAAAAPQIFPDLRRSEDILET